MTDRPCLYVCTTCRANQPLVEGEPVLGQQLFDGVATLLAQTNTPPVELRPIICLGNCPQGCSAAVAEPGKWTYLLGHLAPTHAADLLAYAAAYAASDNGTVWRSGRAPSLRDAIVARVPGHLFTQKETQ
jgi:predicted metal-binding protein